MRDYAGLLKALQDDLDVDDMPYTSDMPIDTIKRISLSRSFFKKLQDKASDTADDECLKLFKESNALCQSYSLSGDFLFSEQIIESVKADFDDLAFSGPELRFNLNAISDGFGLGPGANLGAESYNFFTKLFDSNLTSTSLHLLRLYRSAISGHGTWANAERLRHEYHNSDTVVGNRLSFVPKTSQISRSICTEPTLNMLFQKGIGAVIEEHLRRKFRIDLSTQPLFNQLLARKGSVDGSYGTIDLSSASDSVSLNLLRSICPREFLSWLYLCRSPVSCLPNGEQLELHMVSSMGNAFTFPLQTYLFASIVKACYSTLGIKLELGDVETKNFGVFGDDIIVRKDCYELTVRTLKLFGFRVNEEKSFNTGLFRESCGGDFYAGHNVRGVYIKSLRETSDVYSAINRLVRWSASTGIMLHSTISILMSWVKFLPIPYHDGDAEGIKVPFEQAYIKGQSRDTGGVFYDALVNRPRSFSISDIKTQYYENGAVLNRPRGRKSSVVRYNPDGLMMAFLGGFIRNGRITIRSDRSMPKIKRRCTSLWDYVPLVDRTNYQGGGWEATARELILMKTD